MFDTSGTPLADAGFSATTAHSYGTFTANRWWAVVAATGVILAALYLLWAYQRVFHGPQISEDEPTRTSPTGNA